MSRLLMACLFALMSVFTLVGTANAVPLDEGHVVAQTTAPAPGPDLNPQQQPTPEQKAETKKKLWLGAIALVMFVVVYYRNKKRWTKWRKRRAAAKAAAN